MEDITDFCFITFSVELCPMLLKFTISRVALLYYTLYDDTQSTRMEPKHKK